MLFIFIFSSPQLDEKFYRSTFRLFGEKSIKLLSLVEAPSSEFSSPPVSLPRAFQSRMAMAVGSIFPSDVGTYANKEHKKRVVGLKHQQIIPDHNATE